MKTSLNRNDEQKNSSTHSRSSKKENSNDTVSQFVDNRPAFTIQRKLQEGANDSPQSKRAAQLQAMADSYTSQKTNKVVQLQHAHQELQSDGEVIQTKKTEHFNLPRKLAAKFEIKYSEYKELDEDGYKELMYNKTRETYNENLAKGRRYWAKLTAAISAYKAEDNEAFMEQLLAKRQGYDDKFESNYVTKTNDIGTYKHKGVATSGLAFDGDEVNPKKDVPYTNEVDFGDNSISALHNYAERDMAREADKEFGGTEDYQKRGLPNSEILWQQYKLAAKEQFWFKKESRAKELMKQLSAVKRRQVQPSSTLKTIIFAMPNDKIDLTPSHTWNAGTEEFLAMLGTPNCSGVAFMLADHVDELEGKTITEIKLLGGQDVNLDIKIG